MLGQSLNFWSFQEVNKISAQATLAVYCSSIIFCLNRTLAYWFSMLRLISQFLQLRLSNNINPAYNGCNILLTNNIMLSILLSLSFLFECGNQLEI